MLSLYNDLYGWETNRCFPITTLVISSRAKAKLNLLSDWSQSRNNEWTILDSGGDLVVSKLASTPTIQVRIPLKFTVFSVRMFGKNENKQN